jgi:hypothetical protein
MNYHTSRRAHWLVPALVLVIIAMVAVERAPAQENGSNLEVMRSLTRGVGVEILDALDAARDGRAVKLVPEGDTEDYDFIGQVFTTLLGERGVQVYRAVSGPEGPQSQSGALELRIRATEFSVVYPGVFRSYLIGGKKVRRVASVGIAATLVDPATGAVLDTAEASRDDADQFAHRDLYRVEEGTYEFVHPAIPGSGWTRVVEPVFVSGIIVGLIYLFFSNQSD